MVLVRAFFHVANALRCDWAELRVGYPAKPSHQRRLGENGYQGLWFRLLSDWLLFKRVSYWDLDQEYLVKVQYVFFFPAQYLKVDCSHSRLHFEAIESWSFFSAAVWQLGWVFRVSSAIDHHEAQHLELMGFSTHIRYRWLLGIFYLNLWNSHGHASFVPLMWRCWDGDCWRVFLFPALHMACGSQPAG